MVLADTLSRLPNPENDGDIQLDERIDGINAEIEDPERYTIAIINFSPKKQDVLRKQTADDPKLRELKELIHQGWPENIKDMPRDLRAYWSFRVELAVESGVIFKAIVKKTIQNKDDLHIALLQVRATPADSKLPSPAELLFGRPVTTLQPSRTDPGKEGHRQHLAHRAAAMKVHHDSSSRR